MKVNTPMPASSFYKVFPPYQLAWNMKFPGVYFRLRHVDVGLRRIGSGHSSWTDAGDLPQRGAGFPDRS